MIFAVVFFLSTSGETRRTVLGPLLFAVTVLVFARDGGFINRGLSTRLSVYLGALSYSICMVHVFVQERMANVLNILAKKRPGTISCLPATRCACRSSAKRCCRARC